MIDEGTDLEAVHQLRHTADVIAMIVRDQHVVDLLQTSLVRGAEYAVGIAALVSGPTGVDQQRLPAGVTTSVACPPSTSMK